MDTNNQIKVVGQGTGWIDFEVAGFRASVFADGSIGFPSRKVPAVVRNAARKITGR